MTLRSRVITTFEKVIGANDHQSFVKKYSKYLDFIVTLQKLVERLKERRKAKLFKQILSRVKIHSKLETFELLVRTSWNNLSLPLTFGTSSNKI